MSKALVEHLIHTWEMQWVENGGGGLGIIQTCVWLPSKTHETKMTRMKISLLGHGVHQTRQQVV